MAIHHEGEARAKHERCSVRPDVEFLKPDEARFENVADDHDGGADEHRREREVGDSAAYHVVHGFGETHEARECAHADFTP